MEEKVKAMVEEKVKAMEEEVEKLALMVEQERSARRRVEHALKDESKKAEQAEKKAEQAEKKAEELAEINKELKKELSQAKEMRFKAEEKLERMEAEGVLQGVVEDVVADEEEMTGAEGEDEPMTVAEGEDTEHNSSQDSSFEPGKVSPKKARVMDSVSGDEGNVPSTVPSSSRSKTSKGGRRGKSRASKKKERSSSDEREYPTPPRRLKTPMKRKMKPVLRKAPSIPRMTRQDGLLHLMREKLTEEEVAALPEKLPCNVKSMSPMLFKPQYRWTGKEETANITYIANSTYKQGRSSNDRKKVYLTKDNKIYWCNSQNIIDKSDPPAHIDTVKEEKKCYDARVVTQFYYERKGGPLMYRFRSVAFTKGSAGAEEFGDKVWGVLEAMNQKVTGNFFADHLDGCDCEKDMEMDADEEDEDKDDDE